MKKKIFSSLLLVAFTIAASSMFVSCKDYDDDINANASDIAALQTQLASLQTALDQAKSDATTAHATFLTKTDAASTYATKSALEALSEEIAKLVTADQLQSAINDLTALINGKVSQSEFDTKIAELQDKINSIDSDLNTLKTTYGDRLNTLESGLSAAEGNISAQATAIQNLESALKANGLLDDAQQKSIDSIKTVLTNIQSVLENSSTIESLKSQMNELSQAIDGYSASINLLTVYVKRNLSSLVLKPNDYFGGIEGVKIFSDYTQSYVEKENLKKVVYDAAKGTVILSGIGVATYHYNPATADLSNAAIDFYGNVAGLNDPLTRSGAAIATPLITSTDELLASDVYQHSNGLIDLPFKANFDLIDQNLAKGNGSFIAAQISKGDTTVTSDYALVAPVKGYDLFIHDTAWETSPSANAAHRDNIYIPVSGHLSRMFYALADVNVKPTHTVKYNATLNLSKLISTHYATKEGMLLNDSTYNPEVLVEGNCESLSESEFTALGLSYKYQLVDYTLGSNQTSESVHMTIETDENGDVIAVPRNVDASGNTITNQVANASSVGREPIVLVEILDSDNNIVSFGYMKIMITDVDEIINDVTSDPFDMGKFYFDCDGAEGSLTWSQVEYHIYNDLLGISKKTFDATYEFDSENIYTVDDEGSYVVMSPKLGTVEEISNTSDPDAMTHVLKWSFSINDYKALFEAAGVKDGTSTKDVTVYAKYENIKGGGDVYIPLTINAGNLHFATADLNPTKTLAQWYKIHSNVNATSESDAFEVRANVPTPTEADNELLDTEFTKDLHDYFLNGKLNASLNDEDNYPKLAEQMKSAVPEFEFTLPKADVNEYFSADETGRWTVKGLSGATYTLALTDDCKNICVVNDGKNEIPLGDAVLVSMDEEGVVNFKESAINDDILNYVSHSQLGDGKDPQTFTAYIQIVLPELCYQPEMSSPYFNVRFLRPLNLAAAQPYEIVDAPNDWQIINFTDLVGVTDWRDYTGLADNSNKGKGDGKKQFDFAYYGIKFIADVDNALTDANLGTTARSEFKEATDTYLSACVNAKKNIVNLKLEAATENGQDVVKYMNNSGNTGTYHIFLPIRMEYVFGKYELSQQHTYAVITVKNTEGNAKRN